MKPRRVILLPKAVVKAGSWKVITGKAKMPKTAFPIAGGYVLGRGWHWRVDHLAANGFEFRLLTAFDPTIEEFRAWLTYRRGSEHVVVAKLEFHGDHIGWHCHAPCCDVSEIDAGLPFQRHSLRLPSGKSRHRRDVFGITEDSAINRAFRFFRVVGHPKDVFL